MMCNPSMLHAHTHLCGLQITDSHLTLGSAPRNITNPDNSTTLVHDIIGTVAIGHAEMEGLPYLSGSATLEFNGTSAANATLDFNYTQSNVFSLQGGIAMNLPFTGDDAKAQVRLWAFACVLLCTC